MKALRYNPLGSRFGDSDITEIETEFKVVDSYYIAAKPHGPYLAGEVWLDTPRNRELIEQIKAKQAEIKRITDELTRDIYQLLKKKDIFQR